MKKTLGGIVFTIDPYRYDYCIDETVHCLRELCDHVIILDAGSSKEELERLENLRSHNVDLVSVERSLWESMKNVGKERISSMQNLAKSFLETDYYIVLQADEVLSENSFDIIRAELETGAEGFMLSRINFWQDAKHYVDVPENRQPCSRNVIRIAKLKYDSVGDGESIEVSNFVGLEWVPIYHMGFIRDKFIMKEKVFNIQRNIFNVEPDSKLYKSDFFNSDLWFSGDDLSEFKGVHPKYITNWIKHRP